MPDLLNGSPKETTQICTNWPPMCVRPEIEDFSRDQPHNTFGVLIPRLGLLGLIMGEHISGHPKQRSPYRRFVRQPRQLSAKQPAFRINQANSIFQQQAHQMIFRPQKRCQTNFNQIRAHIYHQPSFISQLNKNYKQDPNIIKQDSNNSTILNKSFLEANYKPKCQLLNIPSPKTIFQCLFTFGTNFSLFLL